MDHCHWKKLFIAVLLCFGTALLFSTFISFSSDAYAQDNNRISYSENALSYNNFQNLKPTNHQMAPVLPAPSADDPRTLTMPNGWGPDAKLPKAVGTINNEVELYLVEFWLNPNGPDGMWGMAEPGTEVTITTPYTIFIVFADPDCGGCWHIQEPLHLNYGDTIEVKAGEGLFPVTIQIPDPVTAEADSNLDEVWGQIGGWVEDNVEIHGYWEDGYQETMTDDEGYFSVVYPDVPRAGHGHIRFSEWKGDTEVIFHQDFQTSDLVIHVNYGHDWVEGHYEAGHNIWITLTNDAGDIKATATGTTGPIPWWGGQSGFSTNYNVLWAGQQPDIQPGDRVHAELSNDQTTSLQVGTIDGDLDVDGDTVSGTIYAPWFTEPLEGGCGVWVEDGPYVPFTVDPNGGNYHCDIGSEGWDLVPGQMVGVEYLDPEGNWVINVFEEPAPRLVVEKWAHGEPAEDGNFIFHIHYRNEGNAQAEDVLITDTLHGFSYLNDTSGIAPTTGTTPGGDPYVTWDLGDVQPGDWGSFDLFVEVTASTGETVTNTVEISTSNPYNTSEPWELESAWEGEVKENDTYLSVGKGAWTWHPAPGHHFVYNVTVCNHGSTASTAVTLTDTLPPETTLVAWWGQEAGWQEIDSQDQLLVVERLSISAWSCTDIYIRVLLDSDAEPGMELLNMAEIHADNNLSPEYDNQTELRHEVGHPYTDLGIYKNWNWGVLTPGGHMRYHINFFNHGNLPVDGPVLITDTLPAGTTFHSWDSWGWTEVTLVEVNDTHVTWELDGFENGYYATIELALDIDPGIAPGTLLTNKVEIDTRPDDIDPTNNISDWEEMVYPHGPNLRVRKYSDWHGHGEGHNAWYQLEVENVGDQTVEYVTITDYYPEEMDLDSGPHVGYWQWWEWAHEPDENFFTVTLESLEPGWNVHIHYDMHIPGDDPVPAGMIFTNAAEVTLVENDTNPEDNNAIGMLFTGPDFFVEKSVEEGVFLPGEQITYLLRYGNNQTGHTWWWDPQGQQWLSDTLPESMSFVAAYEQCGPGEWCERDPDEIDGQTLRWEHWLGSGHWNTLRVVAEISETVTGLDTLVNQAEIYSDQPDVDIDPITDNNISIHEGNIMLPHFTISKSYTSSQIAGMPVTYTLTVENVGHAAGTGLVITDEVPDNVTYISGGSYNDQTDIVTWNVASLPAGESVELAFEGRLGLSGQVVNDLYRVTGSDEGVSSDWGEEVSFQILPPTINAAFNQSATSITQGEAIMFTDASTTNGTPIEAWLWDFGDGQESNLQNPSHTYNAVGIFTVSLQVTDNMGFTAVHTLQNAVEVKTEAINVYLPLIINKP
jgi:uncharacterized repeat protein (TIGR01451 family)